MTAEIKEVKKEEDKDLAKPETAKRSHHKKKDIEKPKEAQEPIETEGFKLHKQQVEELKKGSGLYPNEAKVLRVTVGFTIDKQLNEEIRKRSEKSRLSMSRYVEITLRKALRL